MDPGRGDPSKPRGNAAISFPLLYPRLFPVNVPIVAADACERGAQCVPADCRYVVGPGHSSLTHRAGVVGLRSGLQLRPVIHQSNAFIAAQACVQ